MDVFTTFPHSVCSWVHNIRKQLESFASRNRRWKIFVSDYRRISASREAMSSWKTYGGLLTMKSIGPQGSRCLAEPKKESQPALNHRNFLPKLSIKILSRKQSFQTPADVCMVLFLSHRILPFLSAIAEPGYHPILYGRWHTKINTGKVSFFFFDQQPCLAEYLSYTNTGPWCPRELRAQLDLKQQLEPDTLHRPKWELRLAVRMHILPLTKAAESFAAEQAEELHPQQYQPTKDLLFCQQVQLAMLMLLYGLTCNSSDPDTMQLHEHGTVFRSASQHKAYPCRCGTNTGFWTGPGWLIAETQPEQAQICRHTSKQ